MTPCPACGEAPPPTARYCPACGARLPAPPAEGVEVDTVRQRPPNPDADTVISAAEKQPSGLWKLLEPGTRVARGYVIQGVLGEGGMGVVYKAHDEHKDRIVALKTLQANLAGDPAVRRRFVREGRVMRSFSHRYVVQVYDFLDEERLLAIVMEYIEGPTLTRHLARWGGQLPLPEVRDIFGALLEGMQEAHSQGIVHRDLKPDNVLLVNVHGRLEPRIVDFGIAKILEGTTFTVTGSMLGTCRYISPEQLDRPHLLDHRADIYSLGVSLFQLLTGRCPFEYDSPHALMMAHVREPAPSPRGLRPDLPPRLEELVLRALAKRPEERPASCADFKTELEAALAENTPPRPRPLADRPASVVEADGRVLLLVPEGPFQMGPDRRSVELDAFYVDRVPVTNRDFATFLRATAYQSRAPGFLAHWKGGQIPSGLEEHPVVYVSWDDARAYAAWAGKRLPTEAEWEKAARGTDGRKYPWGKADPEEVLGGEHRRKPGTQPVGSHPKAASPYGVLDMGGTIWEWCEDADDPEFYLSGPSHNPRSVRRNEADRQVVRGGSWMYELRSLRTYGRTSFDPHYCMDGVGFRCAKSA